MAKFLSPGMICLLGATVGGAILLPPGSRAADPVAAPPVRQMERLGRGLVAVRKSRTEVFLSWRLLGLEAADTAFNVYRHTAGAAPVRLNPQPLLAGTNFLDRSADLTQANTYSVRVSRQGAEGPDEGGWLLPANAAIEPLFRIPLRAPHDRAVHHCWVGDLDGDGEYEFVVSLIGTRKGQTQKVAAYKRDGRFLWEVDMGPNSVDSSNIYVTSATIAAGQWDGLTVYDMDGDGRAEVLLKTARGVVFGNGKVAEAADDVDQFLSVLNGLTGAEKTRSPLPNPWKAQRNLPLAALMGIGYADGVRPSLYIHAKNRAGGGGTPFNLQESVWDYRDGKLVQRWSLQWNGADQGTPVNSHQMRLVDVDGDGRDDMVPGMHAINGDGKLLYDLGNQGIIHGDRFHISDLDPGRPGQEGYGIQQDNPSGMVEYFYDVKSGKVLWTNNIGQTVDAARGVAADIDPKHPGYEVWSFYGVRTAKGQKISEKGPWPNFRIWWDGDLLGELLDGEKLEKWDPATQTTRRLVTLYRSGANAGARNAPAFYGDIYGDWREEIVFGTADHKELQVYTTDIPTPTRLYTLAHNPAYRNGMTVKGYMQSHLTDYYLGEGMTAPPRPRITYAGQAAR